MRPKVKERFSVLHNVLNSGRKHVFNQGLKSLNSSLSFGEAALTVCLLRATSCLCLLVIHLS